MPYRRLPKSIDSLNNAIIALKSKIDSNEDNLPFSEASLLLFQNFEPFFMQTVIDVQSILNEQGKATADANISRSRLLMVVSHFIQVFNFNVARGEFLSTDRAYYKIDINDNTVPYIGSKSSLLLWARHLILGEERRINEGGVPMNNPSISLVEQALNDYTEKYKIQSDYKTSYDIKQEELSAMFHKGLEIIREIWDEIEFTYHRDSYPSLRRKCMEWGIVYLLRPKEKLEDNILPK